MVKSVLVLLVITLVCTVVVKSQNQEPNKKLDFGQIFDEIVVSSDLNVRRKSKENRQGKRLLTNVPSGTTGPPGKSTATASRLLSSDGSRVTLAKRERRGILASKTGRLLDMTVVEHLLKSRKR